MEVLYTVTITRIVMKCDVCHIGTMVHTPSVIAHKCDSCGNTSILDKSYPIDIETLTPV